FLQAVGDVQQVAQVVVDPGEGLTELGPGGEVGGQLLQDGQGVGVGRLRFRQSTAGVEQVAQVVVAKGQLLPVLGTGGEVRGELPAERHRPAISVFTVL